MISVNELRKFQQSATFILFNQPSSSKQGDDQSWRPANPERSPSSTATLGHQKKKKPPSQTSDRPSSTEWPGTTWKTRDAAPLGQIAASSRPTQVPISTRLAST